MSDVKKPLILFGAGASFGSDGGFTPPLTAALFDRLREFNLDGWGAIKEQPTIDIFRDDFELGMAELWSRISENSGWYAGSSEFLMYHRTLAFYLFEFAPQKSSLFVQLAERIAASPNWPGILASLNYDRLLQSSLRWHSINPVYAPDPGGENVANWNCSTAGATFAGRDITLCLPHGACNIFCQPMFIGYGVPMPYFWESYDGPITTVYDSAQYLAFLNDDNHHAHRPLPPVMSVINASKDGQVGYSFLATQRRAFARIVADADVIVIVGVRVREHDSHIWDALAATEATIHYCAGQSAGDEFSVWTTAKRGFSHDVVYRSHFSDFFGDMCRIVGL